MDYIIHMYDSNQYERYDLAAIDGATYATGSSIDLDNAYTINDITDVLHAAMSCIGYTHDSVRLGVLVQDTFVPLCDVMDVIDSDRTSSLTHAIGFAYAAIADVPVTLTRREVEELKSRMTLSMCGSGEFNPNKLSVEEEAELWTKLNTSLG